MRKLLLIIDLQKGWLHKTATERAMRNTVMLCKQFDGDLIHCMFRNDPETLFQKQLHWKRFVDPVDTDEIPEIAELKLPKYWRATYSCTTDELRPVYQNYDHIFIAGVFTDISVAATAMDIFDMNIPVSVVRDCVATLHGEDVHEVALKSLEFAIGRRFVISAEQVLEAAAD